nr:immunoglobulin heavy chain junction region [Mus musculus]
DSAVYFCASYSNYEEG